MISSHDATWPAGCPKLPPRCDCSHPSECLFGAPERERPSFAIVWIVGAVLLLAVVICLIHWWPW
jgi:hypothetical protein